jgi:hypothetical protein
VRKKKTETTGMRQEVERIKPREKKEKKKLVRLNAHHFSLGCD